VHRGGSLISWQYGFEVQARFVLYEVTNYKQELDSKAAICKSSVSYWSFVEL